MLNYKHLILTNMNTIIITTYNYTGEYNFSSCCQKDGYIEHDDFSRSYKTQSPANFIAMVTGYLTTKLISFRGDDDTFDNIPALLEEAEQIMRLSYKAAHQSEFHQALIIKACSCINEAIKTINELDCLDSIGAELHCILWTDREDKLEGQDQASLKIYNDEIEVENNYTL